MYGLVGQLFRRQYQFAEVSLSVHCIGLCTQECNPSEAKEEIYRDLSWSLQSKRSTDAVVLRLSQTLNWLLNGAPDFQFLLQQIGRTTAFSLSTLVIAIDCCHITRAFAIKSSVVSSDAVPHVHNVGLRLIILSIITPRMDRPKFSLCELRLCLSRSSLLFASVIKSAEKSNLLHSGF